MLSRPRLTIKVAVCISGPGGGNLFSSKNARGELPACMGFRELSLDLVFFQIFALGVLVSSSSAHRSLFVRCVPRELVELTSIDRTHNHIGRVCIVVL